MVQLVALLGWGCLQCYFPPVLEGLVSVRGRSDLTGVAPTLALLQVLPETSIPTPIPSFPPSSSFTHGLWSADMFKGPSGFIFKDFPLLFFSEALLCQGLCSWHYTAHTLLSQSSLQPFNPFNLHGGYSRNYGEWISSWVNFLGHCKNHKEIQSSSMKKRISWWNCLQRTGRGERNEKSV